MPFLKIFFMLPFFLLDIQRNQVKSEALVGNNIRDAIEKEYPFVVSLGRAADHLNPGDQHFCTGALISHWHVLTAAHCLDNALKDKHFCQTSILQVTIGSIDLRHGKKYFSRRWITYKTWIRQRSYLPKYENNDIAVVKLMEKVDEPLVTPALVWQGTNEQLYGKTATLIGWGATNDASNSSKTLHAASAKILNNEECNQFRRELNLTSRFIHHRYLCTKAEPYVLLTCGDSGGPLVYNENTVIAVNRGTCPVNADLKNYYAADAYNSQKINVHTSVASYKKFIDYCLINF